MNAPERLEYITALSALKPVLDDLPPKIIAVDGAPGVGKTTLSRFLAWRFNITLLETDLFLEESRQTYAYRLDDMRRVLVARLKRDRPVIAEGVVVLRVLADLNLEPSYHIHVKCDDVVSPKSDEWLSYIEEHTPIACADLVLDLPVLD